jgi:hypothetical protein
MDIEDTIVRGITSLPMFNSLQISHSLTLTIDLADTVVLK